MRLEELFAINPDFFNKNWYGEPMDGYTCIDVGIGWYPLVAFAAEKAEEGVYAQQIKEKFGQLSIYCSLTVDCITEDYEEYLNYLSELSLTVCENCGSVIDVTNSNMGGYWLKSYCKECHMRR